MKGIDEIGRFNEWWLEYQKEIEGLAYTVHFIVKQAFVAGLRSGLKHPVNKWKWRFPGDSRG